VAAVLHVAVRVAETPEFIVLGVAVNVHCGTCGVIAGAGRARTLAVPSPNWLYAFQPQHFTAPAAVSAQVWPLPAVMGGSRLGRSGRPGGWHGVQPEVHLRWSAWRFDGSGCRRFGRRGNARVQ
jgi:hypothetical protein